MTAKLKHGSKHRHTHGADAGTPHERLNRQHAMPGRSEGAMLHAAGGPPPPPSPVPSAPPSPALGGGQPMPESMPEGPPGTTDTEEGDQS